MDHSKDRFRELDRFWDLSELMPKNNQNNSVGSFRTADTGTREITAEPGEARATEREEQGSVLTRVIPPKSSGEKLTNGTLTPVAVYSPESSLIHRVELKKWKSGYAYYGEFLADAIRLMDRVGAPAEPVSFFSYVPQYNQLNEAQLAFYLWFRQSAREGRYLQVDSSYVLLYVYELINLGERLDPPTVQTQLVGLWNAYGEKHPGITVKLADWICDYSLIHRLPPPLEGRSAMIAKVISLKEFFIPMPRGDVEGCARSLLRFCSSYDYRTSKFATPEHLPLFDRYIFGAILCAVRYYSADGRLLSGLSYEDSRLSRDAFAGALCVADQRYRLEVSYCSFSRSNELRFLVGDLVKYGENKLRAHLGIKSRMTVYSVPTDLARILDEYFDQELPRGIRSAKKEEKQAYEALYELPRKPLSLTDAARIEQESWSTTRELVDAFEEETVPPLAEVESVAEPPSPAEQGESWREALGERWESFLATVRGDVCAIDRYAKTCGALRDLVADQINEVAFERMGDAVIEETEDGFAVVEDYQEELLCQLMEEENL